MDIDEASYINREDGDMTIDELREVLTREIIQIYEEEKQKKTWNNKNLNRDIII